MRLFHRRPIALANIPVFLLLCLCLPCGVLYAQEVDWDGYAAWENTTVYTRTYVVNQRHPAASDDNPGTAGQPLRTINRAAQMVQAGERVLIHSGVYRETVRPLHGGTSADQMIAYEAAPGAEVIIKGSEVLPAPWVQRSVYTDVLPDSTLEYTWSRKLWMTTLPDSLFEDGYFPFQLPNILPEEHQLMPWARLVKERAPYTATRGMLFQNGERLTQVVAYGDLTRLSGSFWVDADGKTVHIHPYGSGNPNTDLFEVGVRQHLFRPQSLGLGYVQVRGLHFTHCPNGFLRTSTGAVTIMGGHHWIIEDNEISQVNSSGLEFGYYAFEFRDPHPENVQPRPDPDLGGVIVRNNRIHDAGTAGIRSYSVKEGIVENNTIWNIGWQDAQNYWECSGIKILRAFNTLVRGNHIYHIRAGNGIWMDWDIRHTRVTANIIHDVQTIQGGIFVEAAQVPNLVDNNILWDIDGSGIYANDSDEVLIYHNLVARTTGPVVTATVATRRKLNGRWLTATRNRVFNNLFIDAGQPMHLDTASNTADYNLYVNTAAVPSVDLAVWQASGVDQHSTALPAEVTFHPETGYLSWTTPSAVPKVPGLDEVSRDFFGQAANTDSIVPGPFFRLDRDTRVLFSEGFLGDG